MNIKYNSPVILTFSILSTILFFINNFLGGILNSYLILSPNFDPSSISQYISLFTYTLGHANLQHLFGNLSLMLVVGPIIEEKYGSSKLIIMMMLTALFTAIMQITFFSEGLLGASGIVFMLIILASFSNSNQGGIPLTFILVLIFYVGNEIVGSFSNDNISQFAHIAGGLFGSIFGFAIKK
ncbi:MAG: rhomboid family intramembrane serine protease [Flavobacteriales bacterium]|nr:rhomboid family intramembrane serine protease [Flavobacteriales bacterium]